MLRAIVFDRSFFRSLLFVALIVNYAKGDWAIVFDRSFFRSLLFVALIVQIVSSDLAVEIF
jgi:hypothetical protein